MSSKMNSNKQKKRGAARQRSPDSALPKVHDQQIQNVKFSWRAKTPSTIIVPMRNISTGVSSSAGGVLALDLGLNNPSSATNWSALAGLYDQYRVKKVRVTGFAVPGVGTPRPLYAVCDFDNTSMAGITTSTLALSYANSASFDITRDWFVEIDMPAPVAAGIPGGWFDVNAPVSNARLLLTAFSLANSTIYLQDILIDYLVEFKSIR